MIDLTKCVVERLRVDDTFILYRADRGGGARSLLALVPRQPTISSLEKLKNEYALAADLDPACAVLPIELVPHKENMMLVLEDPGGETLARFIGNPLEFDARLRLSVELAETVGSLHRQRLLHRDINPGNILVTEHRGVPGGDLLGALADPAKLFARRQPIGLAHSITGPMPAGEQP